MESGRKDNEGNDGFFAGLIPKDNWFTQMLNTFFGSRHVRIANFSAIFATCFHKQAGEMHGARELGTRPGIPVGSLTLENEPFPDTFFTFPVSSASINAVISQADLK